MFSNVLLLVAVTVVVADVVPDFVIKGKCPVVDEHKLWEAQLPRHKDFGGLWYQQAISTNPYQPLKKCAQIQYIYDGKGFAIKGSGYNRDGKEERTKGVLVPMPLGDPHLMINLEKTFPAPLVILDTDYSNYACMYSCMDHSYGYHSDFAFFFSRRPDTYDRYINKCKEVFEAYQIDSSRLIKTEQGRSCNYFVKDEL